MFCLPPYDTPLSVFLSLFLNAMTRTGQKKIFVLCTKMKMSNPKDLITGTRNEPIGKVAGATLYRKKELTHSENLYGHIEFNYMVLASDRSKNVSVEFDESRAMFF
jgi:hypothetical protein